MKDDCNKKSGAAINIYGTFSFGWTNELELEK